MEAIMSFQQLLHTIHQLPLRCTSSLPEQRSTPPVSLRPRISAETQMSQGVKLLEQNGLKHPPKNNASKSAGDKLLLRIMTLIFF